MAIKLPNNKRLLIGFSVAIGVFLLAKYIVPKFLKSKSGNDSQKNFANADGDDNSGFVAKQYDPNHVNSDGSKGGTWISYNNSNSVGYWMNGKVEEGTPIYGLM